MSIITSATTPTKKAAAHNAALAASKSATKLITPELQAEFVASMAAAQAVNEAESKIVSEAVITTICDALASHAVSLAEADKVLFPVLIAAGRAVPAIEQVSKRYTGLKSQFEKGLQKTGKYTPDSARTIAGKLARIVQATSHGFTFKTNNYNHAYDELRNAENLPFWTKKARSARVPKTESVGTINKNVQDSLKFIASNTNEFIKLLPHAVQIRAAIETLKALNIAVPKALLKMVEA